MRIFGAVGALAGAVLWAVELASFQSTDEPVGEFVGNNAYWLRDLRLMAVVAVVAGLVLASCRVWLSLAVGGTWVAADVALDRADVSGWPAAVGLVAVAAAAVLALAWRPGRFRPAPPLLFAAVTAALVPVAGAIESPTDTEAALTPLALVTGAVLALLTAGCVLAAAPASRQVAVGALLLVAAAGLVALRVASPGAGWRAVIGTLLGTALIAAVAAIAWPTGLRGQVVFGLGALVGYPMLLLWWLLVTAFALPVAKPLTALAGNPPVNSADEDALMTLVGLLTGLVFGLILTRRPDPQDQGVPVVVRAT